MGSSSSKSQEDQKEIKQIEPKELEDLLDLSQKECIQYSSNKKENILHIKEEIISYLNQKNLNASKEKMKIILAEEDLSIIYDLLNRIIESLKEKCTIIVSNNECPAELRAPLDSIIYAAHYLEIKELQLFREKINKKYGSEYISKVDNNTEFLVNEVIVVKLKKNIFSEELIKTKLKQICIEKKIDYEFLCIDNTSVVESHSSQIKNRSNIFISLSKKNSSLKKESDSSQIKDSKYSKKSNDKTKNKNDDDEDEYFKKDPLINLNEISCPDEDKFIKQEGENLFLSYDENIDKKCYSVNNIQNWAESFYNLKSGIILEKYKKILSKSEFSKFFEALNYEYGINNYPLDLNKAFEIYKKAADTSTDTLSMYRLYHIYKKDYKKFNIKERSHILEIFYIMKCFTYLTPYEKQKGLFNRFNIFEELCTIIIDEYNNFYDWYPNIFDFLKKNYDLYDGLNKDDIILIETVVNYILSEKSEENLKILDKQLIELSEKGNPEAMFNLVFINNFYSKEEKKIYLKYYEKLYNMNYYRSFQNYAYELPKEKETLEILKKSISNGYYSHIKTYFEIFMLTNNFEDIFKLPEFKSELYFILNGLIDIIIVDDIENLCDFIFMRNKLIKHYNFENVFKTQFDPVLEQIINYLKKFLIENDDQNKDKIKHYFIQDSYFQLFYSQIRYIYSFGIRGIIEKNYDYALNLFHYLMKNNNSYYNGDYYKDIYYYHFIYIYRNKQRLLNIKNNKSNKSNDEENKQLIEIEKNMLNFFYQKLEETNIKELPPKFFYCLSQLFRYNAINTKDLILEYVFLNRASNAIIKDKIFKEFEYCNIFQELYFKQKAKKKIKEKNKDENFKKIKEAKGAINIEGYGEDGTICPICLENKKSIIALPCKHFFCSVCMDKLLDEGNCPICRTKIKITFDINLKKENLIKSKLIKQNSSFVYNDPFNVPELDPFFDPELDY